MKQTLRIETNGQQSSEAQKGLDYILFLVNVQRRYGDFEMFPSWSGLTLYLHVEEGDWTSEDTKFFDTWKSIIGYWTVETPTE